MSLANPTLDDVWKLFQESDRKWQETRAESDRKWQEMREEMRQMSKDTEQIVKDISKEVKEFGKEVKELSKEVKKTSESLGRLGNKLGDFIEEMVHPAAVRLFKERGIDVHEVQRNVTATRNNEGIEVDLLVVNDIDVIAIECKSTLSIDDVNEHLERLEKLKRVLPAYSNKHVMGAVTAMIIPENVAQYAYKKGLYVIGQTGEHLVVRNDLKFKAKIW